MIDRLKLVKRPSEIILYTSSEKQVDILLEVVKLNNISCYKRHPDDAMLGIYNKAKNMG